MKSFPRVISYLSQPKQAWTVLVLSVIKVHYRIWKYIGSMTCYTWIQISHGVNQALPSHHHLLGQPQNRLEAHHLSLLASNSTYVTRYSNSYRGNL